MIARTKQIASGKSQRPIEPYYFVDTQDEPRKELDTSKLKTHELRYEEIIRRNKEELRKKRGVGESQIKKLFSEVNFKSKLEAGLKK